jgi:hypothetical protein
MDSLKEKKNLSEDGSKELCKKLIEFKTHLLLDSSIKQVFEKNLLLFSSSFDTTAKPVDNFYKTFFKNTSHEAFLSVLNKFQNNIKIIENRLVIFCFDNVGMVDGPGYFEAFAALAVANKNYLKPGEFIEITAGVGGFSTAVAPEFIINRSIVKIDNGNGSSSIQNESSIKARQLFCPVKIKYTDQNGIKKEFQINVDYTVIKECDQ